MDSKRLKLLERAYEAEVNAALSGHGLHMMQTKAALAETMVDEGYLAKCKATMSGATFEGYELTHVGRMAYCMACEDELPNAKVSGAGTASAAMTGCAARATKKGQEHGRENRDCLDGQHI